MKTTHVTMNAAHYLALLNARLNNKPITKLVMAKSEVRTPHVTHKRIHVIHVEVAQ